MAGDLSDDLGGHCSGGADRLRGIDLGVTHLEAVGQHAVQSISMQLNMRKEMVRSWKCSSPRSWACTTSTGQHVLLGVVLATIPASRSRCVGITLLSFVGILVEQVSNCSDSDQATDFLTQATLLFAGHIAVMTFV